MIEFQDVHKAFGPKRVLEGLSLTIADAETLVIIGYSGTGKSVALKHIVGLLHPDAGDVIVDGRAVSTLDRDGLTTLRQGIGYVFQFAALFDSMTVAQNLELGLRRRRELSDEEIDDRVVTNGACHLDARQVSTALDAIDLAATDLLFIENVGNLVCPASWDLGEDAKIVLFSVTEGEDKPAKYPKMFREARVCVFTKMDLLRHVAFRVERAVLTARQINPELQILFSSAVREEGMEEWYGFLRARAHRRSAA